jgi:ElaB/YqjD/DUF883 family membrane-anchored ribosome-binding protein
MVEQVQESGFKGATDKLKEGAQDFKKAVTESASQTYEKANETFNQYCEQTSDMIKENPMKSMLIAAGIGALLGMLMTRK